MEEEASAELINPRISFSDYLATFAATTTCSATQPEPSRPNTSLMSRRRRRVPEPEFDFANAATADVAPADRLFADGKLLPVPPLLPTTPDARAKQPLTAAWQQKATRPAPRSWASPFARSSSVNSAAAAAAAAASGRITCPAFPLMRSRLAGLAAAPATVRTNRPHCKKVAPTTTATSNSNGGAARSVYYYGYRGGRNCSDGHGGGVRVSPVLNVTPIGTSVVNMLSYLLCDCGEKAHKQSRGASE